MKAKRTVATNTTTEPTGTGRAGLFDKTNYTWMLIGAAVMILGFLLIGGGRSSDPNTFDPKEVYSTTRITIAPIFILAGLAIEVYAIFKNPR